jgi:hypothetical protein
MVKQIEIQFYVCFLQYCLVHTAVKCTPPPISSQFKSYSRPTVTYIVLCVYIREGVLFNTLSFYFLHCFLPSFVCEFLHIFLQFWEEFFFFSHVLSRFFGDFSYVFKPFAFCFCNFLTHCLPGSSSSFGDFLIWFYLL